SRRLERRRGTPFVWIGSIPGVVRLERKRPRLQSLVGETTRQPGRLRSRLTRSLPLPVLTPSTKVGALTPLARVVSMPDLSIVIPTLNEAENLRLLLPLIREVINELGVRAEVIVIDGGSSDDSKLVAHQLDARVVEQTERGFGGALLAGFAAATAPYVITMD